MTIRIFQEVDRFFLIPTLSIYREEFKRSLDITFINYTINLSL
jgi:hypothetical protein